MDKTVEEVIYQSCDDVYIIEKWHERYGKEILWGVG